MPEPVTNKRKLFDDVLRLAYASPYLDDAFTHELGVAEDMCADDAPFMATYKLAYVFSVLAVMADEDANEPYHMFYSDLASVCRRL